MTETDQTLLGVSGRGMAASRCSGRVSSSSSSPPGRRRPTSMSNTSGLGESRPGAGENRGPPGWTWAGAGTAGSWTPTVSSPENVSTVSGVQRPTTGDARAGTTATGARWVGDIRVGAGGWLQSGDNDQSMSKSTTTTLFAVGAVARNNSTIRRYVMWLGGEK